ncbi:MAG TPA: TIGR03086 family metal-binding protein [Blastococcus sp.]|nr:TIGR03086 family metal-binding protein [Blastococcus sp.]
MRSDDDPAVLRRALDQLAGLLDDVPGGTLGNRTPCEDWSVQDLVDHIVAAPARFARMVRGESVDWSAPTAPAGGEPAARFRSNADDLLRAVGNPAAPGGGVPIDWQCAELAVHTWDLSSALGRSTGDLDQEVAERGLAFMRASLTDDNRGSAFGPEQPAPEGADAYRRVAAFAGRSV